ncbi:formimidoylglutamate deiminase [Aquipuribacter sp. MA13-6]|uniref:formimidoylglutamate deiminase n=1 Tax=unclassified Aquipuribacter TaxID=2635084 RepID=UPI003EEB0366
MSPQAWFAEHAWLPSGVARDVRVEAVDGYFTAVVPGGSPAGATPLPGVVLPGLADGHSHAFHRALRGRTHGDGGSFWTWREQAYAVADRLDPDSYLDLARACFAELVLAGVTTVGEFHYLHHGPGGHRYDDPNAMAEALRQAAADAGLRLTLLDACYLAGGLDAGGSRPVTGTQLRFADADVDAWAGRVEALRPSAGLRVGVAAHSVRAVPREALAAVVRAAAGRPLHVHVAEQPAENADCQAAHGLSPVGLLAAEGVLGPTTTVVHATHLDADDVRLLGRSGTGVCLCPTTERDLADGIGPGLALHRAGSPLSVGSDQHVAADLLEEARGVELHERLASGRRGCFTPAQLLAAATAHDRIGWPEAGRLQVGAPADLVAVRLDTPRTAGCRPDQVPLVAGAADVDTVVVQGRTVVDGGHHVLGDVGRLLGDALASLDLRAGGRR